MAADVVERYQEGTPCSSRGARDTRLARFLAFGAQFVNIATQALLLAGVEH